MGYQAKRKRYMLVFPETSELHGLEITVGGLSLREFNEIREKCEAESDAFARKAIEMEYFISLVYGWNLEEEEHPLEVSVQNFETLDPADTTSILRSWWSVALGNVISGPLGQPSNDGASTARLESLPMADL